MYTVGSLFAGIGGICTGFKEAGFEPLWANELDKHACMTFRANLGHRMHEGDITEIRDPMTSMGSVDILTSGFPCQAFSIAGGQLGFKDPRGNMFMETARFIHNLQPQAFMLENVKNLVNHDKGRTMEVIESELRGLGYSFEYFVLNSFEYGNIPQNRERVYIVGFKDEEYANAFEKPKPIPLTRTIHDCVKHDWYEQKYYYDGTKYYPMLLEAMENQDTVYQLRRIYVRENKNNLCPTLTANMGTGGHNVPLIRDKYGIRKLLPFECLNFQGFPCWFHFPENMANCHCYKQAGNSVTVPVITRVAKAMMQALDVRKD